MDQASNRISRVKAFLSSKSIEELSHILNRYCGPHNTILSNKKFGYIMPASLVMEELTTRSLEHYLLDSKSSVDTE